MDRAKLRTEDTGGIINPQDQYSGRPIGTEAEMDKMDVDHLLPITLPLIHEQTKTTSKAFIINEQTKTTNTVLARDEQTGPTNGALDIEYHRNKASDQSKQINGPIGSTLQVRGKIVYRENESSGNARQGNGPMSVACAKGFWA
ncbi:hypothetical protein PV04_04815 [Phialophora macrospora]|uniref:Uncharacterized protein n=1 Tax=Phialophora macrospora TaxID=1851006 RepID=A0A0D2CUS5_9EURO|nr:hypothetical protein PV04_04815 [Phialophora macrospora]